MATKAKTTITAQTVTQLRTELTDAMAKVLDKHGLTATLGRITFMPGKEFRCKLTVSQETFVPANENAPKVGEVWNYGGKMYKIIQVTPANVIGSRQVNTRRWGLMNKSFRINLASICRTGYRAR